MEWTKDKFYRMYEEYNGMVYRLCMLYLKNESDAGDAVQDIFLKMWEKKPNLQMKYTFVRGFFVQQNIHAWIY